MKKKELSLNKETIARLNSQEMQGVDGGGIKDWITGAISLATGALGPGGPIAGGLCLTVTQVNLSEENLCNSSVCGS